MENEFNNSYPYIQKPNGENNSPNINSINQNLPNTFAKTAMVLGIIAILSVFTFTVYPAMIFGSLAIILAVLSKGMDKKMHKNAGTGVITGIIALVINVIIIAASFYMVFTKTEYRQQLNNVYESLYGESFDDMLESIKDGTFDYNELY